MKTICLTKRLQFSAAHTMSNSKFSPEENESLFGKCQNVHGHNYILEVTVSGVINEDTGYFVNLRQLGEELEEHILSVISHQFLNEVLPGKKNKPVTLEVLATWIWETLHSTLRHYTFEKIRICENDENSVEIYK